MNDRPKPDLDGAIDILASSAVTRGYREGLLRAAEIITANHRADALTLLDFIKLEVEVDDPEIFEKVMAK
jgi:hypothetical protein